MNKRKVASVTDVHYYFNSCGEPARSGGGGGMTSAIYFHVLFCLCSCVVAVCCGCVFVVVCCGYVLAAVCL